MNIIDILRGLPFPMQAGILQLTGMTDQKAQPAAPEAGGGRGFVNPPVVNPAAPRPVPTPVVAAPAVQAPIAAAMAPAPVSDNIDAGGGQNIAMTGPDRTPDNIDAGGGQSFAAAGTPMQQAAGSADPGILSRMGFQDGNQALMALGGALAAAGSADPARTALQIAAQQTEDRKIAEARRRANQPKVDPITGTPFFQITYPDGRTEVSSNPALADYYKRQSESKTNAAIEKAVLDDRLARNRDQDKAGIKASDEARPMLNDIQGLKSRWQEAQSIVSGQGTKAQLQGIPGVSAVAGFFGGDEVAKNKFLEGLTVDETLLNTARTKGAISNQEMMLFKSPIPSITDDREKVWKPWIEKRLEVLDKLEKFYADEVGRAPARPATPGTAAPAAGGVARPASKADFDALPKGSRFIAPDGKEYIK